MPVDDVTSFFENKNRGYSSITNTSHSTVTTINYDNGVRYVRIEPPGDGWVAGENASGKRVSLCEYTKVKLLEKDNGRVYFRLLDGNCEEVGNILSMKEKGAVQYLHRGKREAGINIEVIDFEIVDNVRSVQRGNEKLSQRTGVINFSGLSIPVTLSTITYNPSSALNWRYSPLPVGIHKLKAPDYPHIGGYSAFYRVNESIPQFDLVWFRIECDALARYLHMGHVSEGCLTVVNINAWEALYHKIICCRSDGNNTDIPGGGMYIGQITVIKRPANLPFSNSLRDLSSY